MVRFLFFLAVSSLLVACSKDKPAPVAPAGKVVAAPAAPANLRFEAVTDSSVRVLWDAVAGATDYDINYKPAVGGRWTNEPHRGVRLYNTINDLAPNTEYRWAVRAENSDGTSEWIHGPNFTTRSSEEDGFDDVLASPINLRFDAPTDSSCTVRWDAVAGATDYDINYKPAVGGRWTNEPHRGVRLYNTINDLAPNTEYRWAVRAENSDGTSEWIHGPNFTTLDAAAVVGPPVAVAGSPATDRAALMAFYKATDGDYWEERYKVNWLSNAPLGEWFGVTTDENGRVIGIAIHHDQLIGPIPLELSQLDRLETLSLFGNRLSGPIPSELSRLTNLQYLALEGNRLSGPIPPELSQLTNLKLLGLGGNQLSGAIPPELGQLDSLLWLGLGGNQLSGSIPPELGQLANLDVLGLGGNQLSGAIPPELGNLKRLGTLFLHNNQLSGAIPPELSQLTNLKHLNLDNNQLSGAIPPELGNLKGLDGLYLDNNQLSGSIPPELGNLKGLGGLNLSGNRLSGAIPSALGNLKRLNLLFLRGNQLSGCVPRALLLIPTNDFDRFNPRLPVCD